MCLPLTCLCPWPGLLLGWVRASQERQLAECGCQCGSPLVHPSHPAAPPGEAGLERRERRLLLGLLHTALASEKVPHLREHAGKQANARQAHVCVCVCVACGLWAMDPWGLRPARLTSRMTQKEKTASMVHREEPMR